MDGNITFWVEQKKGTFDSLIEGQYSIFAVPSIELMRKFIVDTMRESSRFMLDGSFKNAPDFYTMIMELAQEFKPLRFDISLKEDKRGIQVIWIEAVNTRRKYVR